MTTGTIRRATHEDYEDVVAFTADTWADRETPDYVPDVFHDWVATDGADQRTVVVEVPDDDAGGEVVGLCRGTILSDHEAWLQGMRVAPGHRGGGHGLRMVEDLFEWARDRGATVARNLVFGWNDAGLGQSLAAGFEPRASFRWARPAPGDATPALSVTDDAAAAWSYWARSEAREVLGGLALASDQSWAVAELGRERFLDTAADERAFAVAGDGTRGMALRARETEAGTGDASRTVAEYAVGAWADGDAAAALVDAIRADAADLGVDGTRVLIPESPRHVAEAAAARATLGEHADFVLEADLTGAQ